MNSAYRWIFFFWSVLFISANLFSQDSLSVPDSIRSAFTESDSTDSKQPSDQKKKSTSSITDKINYTSERYSVSVDKNRLYLNGNAVIKYQNMTLKAEHIIIDKSNNKLYARGEPDSVDPRGKMHYKGNPYFEEKGREPMQGDFIEYDFNTERGKIQVGKTDMDPGFYRGDSIYKIADSTLLVEDGYFTTCNLDHPHYYFRSDRMRIRIKDKVVAKPVYFYIADIPLAVLPFGVFPNKGGRHSGLLMPSYGESRYGGRFLEGFGYYWVPNDYFDATIITDFYDKQGFTYRASANYAVRYHLKGSISAQYYPKYPKTSTHSERWRIQFAHNQTIDPTLSISGRGSFQSDKNFARETSANINDRLRQNINSSLTISKRFKGTKNSMSLSFSQNRDLVNDNMDYTLPNLTFNRSTSSIYETFTGKSLGSEKNWFQNITFSYNGSALSRGSRTFNSRDSSFTNTVSQGINHNLSFNGPFRLFKYFNINPSLSYKELWVDKITEASFNHETNSLEYHEKNQFRARRTFSTSVNAKTTLYGLFEPNIGDLKFIRHKMDPSISWTYTPDFSAKQYGYYQTFVDTSGRLLYNDRFRKNPFGSTSRGESQTINLSLGNLFQAKLIDADGKETKKDLLTLNFNTGYNFKASEFKWSSLSTSLRTTIYGKSISASFRNSFYEPGKSGRDSSGTFFYDNGKLFPRLTFFNTSIGFSLDNNTFKKEDKKQKKQPSARADSTIDSTAQGILNTNSGITTTGVQEERKETKNISIPWSTSFNLNYTYNATDAFNPTKTINMSASAKLSLSKNWKISWQGNFDLVNRKLVYHSFNIYRDLHCWEMSFNWQPKSNYYSFQINIKEALLKDIKVTKHPSGSTYNDF